MVYISQFNTSVETLSELTEQLIRHMSEATTHNGQVRLALSGGKTGQQIFNLWRTSYSNHPIWHKTDYFWIDERCVPPENDESNFGVAKRLFFNPLNICSGQIHPIHGEKVPEKEAIRYTDIIYQRDTSEPYLSSPFQCAILGIGDDGHTASIFSIDTSSERSENYYVTRHPLTGQQRITASMQILLSIPCIFIALIGKEKDMILRQLDSNSTPKTPGIYLLEHHDNIHIFTNTRVYT